MGVALGAMDSQVVNEGRRRGGRIIGTGGVLLSCHWVFVG